MKVSSSLAELFEVWHVSVGDPLPDDAGEALLVLLLGSNSIDISGTSPNLSLIIFGVMRHKSTCSYYIV